MPATLVDTNVLIDIATEDRNWFDWSRRNLQDALGAGPIAINPIIYAEVSIPYASIETLEDALSEFRFERLSFAMGSGLSCRESIQALSQQGRSKTLTAAGFLHRRPRSRIRSDSADA